MYYRAGGYQSFIASAVSDNVLDWSEEKGIRIGGLIFENKIGRIDGHDVLHSSDGSLRMYFSAHERGTGASIPVIRWTALYGVSQKCALMYRQMKIFPT